MRDKGSSFSFPMLSFVSARLKLRVWRFPAESRGLRRAGRIGGWSIAIPLYFNVNPPSFLYLSQLIPHSLVPAHLTMESEAFEDLQKGGGTLRTVKDLSAGALGGIAQVLIGMSAVCF